MPGKLIIGILIKATTIRLVTKIIFSLSILIFMYPASLSLKEYTDSKEIKISVGKKKIGILKIL